MVIAIFNVPKYKKTHPKHFYIWGFFGAIENSMVQNFLLCYYERFLYCSCILKLTTVTICIFISQLSVFYLEINCGIIIPSLPFKNNANKQSIAPQNEERITLCRKSLISVSYLPVQCFNTQTPKFVAFMDVPKNACRGFNILSKWYLFKCISYHLHVSLLLRFSHQRQWVLLKTGAKSGSCPCGAGVRKPAFMSRSKFSPKEGCAYQSLLWDRKKIVC